MLYSLIAAHSQNRVIGQEGRLPWHLPADLKHFKAKTLNKPIVMGRKTYDSIGRPLPHRRNIVLTHQVDFSAPGIEVVHSLDALASLFDPDQEVMVIGGEQIYRLMLPLATKLYLTEVKTTIPGDAYFPEFESLSWQETAREVHEPDAENPLPYDFVEYIRHLL